MVYALNFTNVFIPTAVSSLDCLHSEVIVPSCTYLWCLPRCYRAHYRPSLKIYNNNNNPYL